MEPVCHRPVGIRFKLMRLANTNCTNIVKLVRFQPDQPDRLLRLWVRSDRSTGRLVKIFYYLVDACLIQGALAVPGVTFLRIRKFSANSRNRERQTRERRGLPVLQIR